jgi:ankyrin repeat protein
VEALIGHADINAVDNWFSGSALHSAARCKNVPAIKLLLAAGADVNLVHWAFGTPLMVACQEDDLGTFARIFTLSFWK